MRYAVLFFAVLAGGAQANACSYETINTIVEGIRPPYTDEVAGAMSASIDNLSLCDENRLYAGMVIGQRFSPPYTDSTSYMSSVASSKAAGLGEEFVRGLAIGIISKLSLPYTDSTFYMLRAILNLAAAYPENAKMLALELLKHQSPPYTDSNNRLLETVRSLRDMAVINRPPPQQGGSSIWAFRSQTQSCEDVTGPWGRYEICPKYSASVSDQFGNRIVLACRAGNDGIDFRVSLGNELWHQAQAVSIQTLAFGTGSTMQSLGVPYVISRDHTLLAEEPVADEVLQQLRAAKALKISIRANSGESNLRLNFSLSGSNKAIASLLSVCR